MDSNLNLGAYPLFAELQTVLQGNDNSLILSFFDRVMNYNVHEIQYLAVEGIVFKAITDNRASELLPHLGKYIVDDYYRQERVDILCHLPKHLTLNYNVARCLTLSISYLLLEADQEQYLTCKQRFAEQLIAFIDPNLIGWEGEYDPQSIEVLRYLEKYVDPIWGTNLMQAANDLYSVMAKRVCQRTINDFMEVVMESDKYCYHGLMLALTPAAADNVLRMEAALKFMQEKHDTCANNPSIGLVKQCLRDRIEFQFIRGIMKNNTVYGIEKLMKVLRFEAIMVPEVLEEAAKLHLEDLHLTLDRTSVNSWLIYLTRQCALARYHDEEKNDVLLRAMHFFDEVRDLGMTEVQERVFTSVLASQSFPKTECKHSGDMNLFSFLFTRLMGILPTLVEKERVIDLQSLQTTLYSIYCLYDIDSQLHKMMVMIDPLWLDKVSHAMDMFIVTSRNFINYIKGHTKDAEDMRRAKQCQSIILDVGKLLGYLLGTLGKKDLRLKPSFMGTSEMFEYENFTSSFTHRNGIYLKEKLDDQKTKVTYPHRIAVAFLHKLNRRNYKYKYRPRRGDKNAKDKLEEGDDPDNPRKFVSDDPDEGDVETSYDESSSESDSEEDSDIEEFEKDSFTTKCHMHLKPTTQSRTACHIEFEALSKSIEISVTRNDDDRKNADEEDRYSEYTIGSDDGEEYEEEDFLDGFDDNSRDIRRAIRQASIREFRVQFGCNLFFTYDPSRLVGMIDFGHLLDLPEKLFRRGDIGVLLGHNNETLEICGYPWKRHDE